MNDKPGAPAQRMYYVDTLSQNNKTYHYRVVGVSPFGKESKPSEVIAGQGKPTLAYTAHLKNYTLTDDGSVTLVWDFPKEGEAHIHNFSLNRASKAKGPYEVVVTDIGKGERTLSYAQLKASNYFTLTANGKGGTNKTSLPIFVQPIDSIPPKAPVGLTGVIDSTGVTQVMWTPNIENDLLGYRIFRSNRKDEELVQLTSDPIQQTTFTDTVQVASLNSTVYYSIVAVDQRFNQSEYSAVLALEKPDIVPPNSPIFSGYKVANDSVRLQWIPSASKDVVQYELYRKDVTAKTAAWQAVFKTPSDTTYTDIGLQLEHSYRYAISATDKNGLQSAPSPPITVSIAFAKENTQTIKGLQGIANKEQRTINLSWRNPSGTFSGYIIYKKKNEGTPRLFRELPGSIQQLKDDTITPNNTYTYYIKPLLPNGKYGKPDSVIVTF
ncbi:hypothetical protein ABW636_11385 [Aquimarina sp. 2201CG1-2-11]|uniref:fibronectin type III domain-containing protein n=1 Tax=Aquimarina discodermiae TaxID=3231043 RepID=UPI003461CE4F